MNAGLLDVALLLGSGGAVIAGGMAAIARRRAATPLFLNIAFAGCFAYFAAKSAQFGSIVVLALGAAASLHLVIAYAIVERAPRASRNGKYERM